MKWNLSLRNRILVPTLGLLVAVTFCLSAVSFWMSRAALEHTLDDQLTQICSAGIRQVDSWVESQRMTVAQWAAQPHLLAALQDTSEAKTARTVVSSELAHALQLYGFYANLQLVDLKGDTLSAADPALIGTLNVADRQYFKDALAGKGVISDVLKSKIDGNPIVVIAAPVKEGATVRGVIFGSLDLGWFNANFISHIKVMETGYAYMVDENGVFIAHPDKTKILAAKLADYEWGAAMQGAKTGKVNYTLSGIAKTTRFLQSERLGWRLVVTVPLTEAAAAANAAGANIGRLNLFLGLGAIAAGALIMYFTARSISQPIQGISVQLASGADQTAAAANQVSGASQSLAEGSSEQASSLEETSSSLEEMSSMTKNNADSASRADALTQEARDAADAGARDMRAMSSAIHDIKISSAGIAKIIKTIDEIAFQTRVLALNAAVEAARAGVAGAGFAVVAEEVGALAQRSATAAQETASKIEDAIGKTTLGVQISDRVAASLGLIVGKVREVNTLISEVANANREQNDGVQQINIAISQMDKVVQSNAAAAEESASAAEELNAQATGVKEAVMQLQQLVNGTASSRHHHPKIRSRPLSGGA